MLDGALLAGLDNHTALDRLRRGQVLRGVYGHSDLWDVQRGDLVQWSAPSARIGRPREAHLGIVMYAPQNGSWADVWQSSSLALRQNGYQPEDCRLLKRVRTSTGQLQIVWDGRYHSQ
jgi:hypothetical protein